MLNASKEYDRTGVDEAVEQAINLGCQVRKFISNSENNNVEIFVKLLDRNEFIFGF